MKNDPRRPLYTFWTPNYWPIWFLLALLRLVCLLPHKARLAVGFGLGRLLHSLSSSRRAIARRNIELCFPELSVEERNTLVRKHFACIGASLIEMGIGMWASDREMQRLTRVNGCENVLNALEEGHGVIMIGAHFTALEASGRVIKIDLPPYDVVYRKLRNPFINQIVLRNRQTSAREAIERGDIRGMIRNLRNGVPVWYAPDQGSRGKTAELVPFFGVPCMMTTATGKLAEMGNSVVVPLFQRRLDDGTYVVDILPRIEAIPSGDLVQDSQSYNEVLEAYIRECPEQYLWIHRKFKNRPAPLPDAYADLDSLK
jgi:KDO2-lipid IV(A) lauroyltransferase